MIILEPVLGSFGHLILQTRRKLIPEGSCSAILPNKGLQNKCPNKPTRACLQFNGTTVVYKAGNFEQVLR